MERARDHISQRRDRQGATGGLLPISLRFMAPEEFERGALIDERTTVFTMGRTAFVCLGDDIGGAMGEVVRRACR